MGEGIVGANDDIRTRDVNDATPMLRQHTPARPGRDRAFLFPGKIPDSSQDHRSCDKLFLGKSRGPAYVALTQATAGRVLPGKARSRACPRAVSPARIPVFTQSAIFQ